MFANEIATVADQIWLGHMADGLAVLSQEGLMGVERWLREDS
jgi:hypothetical protein